MKGASRINARQELQDELVAVLGATRELPPEMDQHLADAFLKRVEQQLPEPAEAHGCDAKQKTELLPLVRYVLRKALLVFLLAPVVAVVGGLPVDDVARHIHSGSVPALYYVTPILAIVCIVAVIYLERNSVHERISRHSRVRTSFPRA